MSKIQYRHGYFLIFTAFWMVLSPRALHGNASGGNAFIPSAQKHSYEESVDAERARSSNDLHNRAMQHKDRGEYRDALELLQRALDEDERAYGPEHPQVAIRLSNLALLYQDIGMPERAQPLYERALAIDQKAYGTDHPAVARDVSNLAGIFYGLGAYDLAQPLYERALAIDQKAYGSEHPAVAQDLSNLGGVAFSLGDYAPAKLLYERALAIDETSYGSNHSTVVKDLNNLAAIYRALGDYPRSESLYRRALTSAETVYAPDNAAIAPVLNNLAELLTDMGRYEKAEPLFKRALDIYSTSYGPEHPHVATVLNNLAGLGYALGNYDDAESLYEQALAIDEKMFGEEHPRVAIRLNNLAEIHYARGQLDKAQQLYMRSLTVAEAAGHPELLWRVESNLAYLLRRQKNPDAAIFFGKEAVNIIQGMRSGISTIEKDLQQSFLKTKWQVYVFLADLLIDRGRLPEARQVLDMQKEEEYFDFLCREKGAEDVRSTTAAYTDEELGRSEDFQKSSSRIASLGKECVSLRQKKILGLDSAERTRYEQVRKDLSATRRAFSDALTKMIAGAHDALPAAGDAAMKAALPDKPETMEALLRTYGHGAAFIHYLITNDRLRIIVTTSGNQIERDVVISPDELNRKIMSFRGALENPRSSPLAESRDLYGIMIAPIDGNLRQEGAQTLLLNLYGVLRYLPVTALHDGSGYLLERYRMAVCTPAAKTVMGETPQREWMVGGLGMSHSVRNFEPLRYVPTELESIIRRSISDEDGVLPGVIYLDDAFSRRAFESVLREGYPVIHIASHFELKPGTKKSSYLLLGDGTTLSLAEIQDRHYDFSGVDMLTLSACNTAVSASTTNGNEVESFGALAQNQGAKGVLATLWQVGDRSTCILMQNFYQLRAENPGITKAEALNRAQLMFVRGEALAGTTEDATRGMRVSSFDKKEEREPSAAEAAEAYKHPFYWAPFILMGNWL
jgi:CHAT domain-containing protein/tetratricopeptide (TPR) repeat protein